MSDGQIVTVAGRRVTVHRRSTLGDRVVAGEVRCNLSQTDEDGEPRDVLASQVPEGARYCGWCFPKVKSGGPE